MLALAVLFVLAVAPPVAAEQAVNVVRVDGALATDVATSAPVGAPNGTRSFELPIPALATVGDGHLILTPGFGGASQEFWAGGPGGSTVGYEGSAIVLGDFNGDGNADLGVGAFDLGTGSHGAVEVRYGIAGKPFPAAPDWVFNAPNGDWLGSPIVAGDFNGDGFDDLAAGNSRVSSSRPNEAVRVFFGSPTGLGPSAGVTLVYTTGTAYFGHSLAGGLDLDADGYDDLIVDVARDSFGSASTLYVYWGSASGPNASNPLVLGPYARGGLVLAPLGDTDGDGADEFAVGSPYNGTSRSGSVEVFEGVVGQRAAVLVWRFNGSIGQYLGTGVAGGKDLDGDGINDLAALTGDPLARVLIFKGQGGAAFSTSPALGPSAPMPYSEDYCELALLDDLDGDDRAEIVVALPLSPSSAGGQVQIRLSASGWAAPARVIDGPQLFGWSVLASPDVDGDAIGDLFVGDLSATHVFQLGRAVLFSGASMGIPSGGQLWVGGALVWSAAGPLETIPPLRSIGPEVAAYMASHLSEADAAGLIWVPVTVDIGGQGAIVAGRFDVRYSVVLPPTANAALPLGQSAARVTWLPANDTDGDLYWVWWNASGTWARVAAVGASSHDFQTGPLAVGPAYCFAVSEQDSKSGAESVRSAPACVVSNSPFPPEVPRGVRAAGDDASRGVTVSWNASAFPPAYVEVWRKAAPDGTWLLLGTTSGGSTSWHDSSTLEGAEYAYRCRAVDAGGLASSDSQAVSAWWGDPPPRAPQITAARANIDGRSFQVAWTSSDPRAEGFLVAFAIGGASLMEETGPFRASPAEVRGFAPGSNLVVRMIGLTALGTRSAPSESATVTLVDRAAPPTPTGFWAVAHPAGGSVYFGWASPTDPDTTAVRLYLLDTGVGGAFVDAGTFNLSATSFVMGPLPRGGVYGLQVAALDAAGHESEPTLPVYVHLAPDVNPPRPTIDPIAAVVTDAAMEIGGACEAGLWVEVFVNGVHQATAMCQGDGRFAAPVILESGANVLTALTVEETSSQAAFVRSSTVSQAVPVWVDDVAPRVIWSTAASGSDGVPLDAAIALRFSEPLAPGSLRVRVFGPNGGEVAAHVALSPDGGQATIAPDAPWVAGGSYTLYATGQDLAGNPLRPWSGALTAAAAEPPAESGTTPSIDLAAVLWVAVAALVAGAAIVLWPAGNTSPGAPKRFRQQRGRKR